ncbi:MAG: MBL fold metallo-hydrolase [Gammaproteobacteria bacterium]|nr:MAG: MBL fold metallo-hydrolase [Gammaproteobacteria bacterium]
MQRLNVAALVIANLAAPVWAQQDFSTVEIETVPVADGVYMLVGSGGNIGLSVGEDGAFVIDDQFAPLSEKIMAAIAAVTDADVKFLVNTHFHGDHVGGNEAFGAAGAVIIAHENVRARMSTDQFREIFNQPIPASPVGALPILTFSDEMTFHWNGDTIRAIHVAAAHTDGDTILYFQNANVIHMGDTFFNGFYPFIDVSSDGDIDGIIAAGYRALTIANEDTAIIPGHGPLSDAAGLAAWLEMLKVTRVNMQSLIDQGLSEDEAVAARPTAASDEQYGGGFMNPENYNRLLYQSLIRN